MLFYIWKLLANPRAPEFPLMQKVVFEIWFNNWQGRQGNLSNADTLKLSQVKAILTKANFSLFKTAFIPDPMLTLRTPVTP